MKQRDNLFDNYKAFLILLVVIGHFIEPCYDNNLFLYHLKWWIVAFHMPAFIFISGYFSKRELPAGELIRRLAVPYIVYECVYCLVYLFIIHKPTKLYLQYPKFSLWYLLALFVWRAITPLVKRIPHHMALAVALGLLIGCCDMKDNFLSIPRILVFYPFFLAGIHTTNEQLSSLKARVSKAQAVAALLCATAVLFLFQTFSEYTPKIFYGRYNYHFLHQSVTEGMLCRGFFYLTGSVMTVSILLLMEQRRTRFSCVGTRTMAIYLFHGLTYVILKDAGCLQNIDTAGETLLLLTGCLALTALYALPPFTFLTSAVSGWRLPQPAHPASTVSGWRFLPLMPR